MSTLLCFEGRAEDESVEHVLPGPGLEPASQGPARQAELRKLVGGKAAYELSGENLRQAVRDTIMRQAKKGKCWDRKSQNWVAATQTAAPDMAWIESQHGGVRCATAGDKRTREANLKESASKCRPLHAFFQRAPAVVSTPVPDRARAQPAAAQESPTHKQTSVGPWAREVTRRVRDNEQADAEFEQWKREHEAEEADTAKCKQCGLVLPKWPGWRTSPCVPCQQGKTEAQLSAERFEADEAERAFTEEETWQRSIEMHGDSVTKAKNRHYTPKREVDRHKDTAKRQLDRHKDTAKRRKDRHFDSSDRHFDSNDRHLDSSDRHLDTGNRNLERSSHFECFRMPPRYERCRHSPEERSAQRRDVSVSGLRVGLPSSDFVLCPCCGGSAIPTGPSASCDNR